MRISDWSSDVCSSDLPEPALAQLDAIIAQRERDRPTGSYTTRLFEQGAKRIAQKVGEEGVETALASVAGSNDELLGEAADLIYHLLVLLRAKGLELAQVDGVRPARQRGWDRKSVG